MKTIIALLIIILFFSGCGLREVLPEITAPDEVPPDSPDTVEEARTPEVIVPIEANNKSGTIGTEDGYYYVMYHHGNSNLMYTDYATMQQIYLCSTPNCTHSDESCPSFLGQKSLAPIAQLSTGELLMMQTVYTETAGYNTLELYDTTGRFIREVYNNNNEEEGAIVPALSIIGISEGHIYCVETDNYSEDYFSIDIATGHRLYILEDNYYRPGANLSLQFAAKVSYALGDYIFLSSLQPNPDEFSSEVVSYEELPSENLLSLFKMNVSTGLPELIYMELIDAMAMNGFYVGEHFIFSPSDGVYKSVHLENGEVQEYSVPHDGTGYIFPIANEMIEGYFSLMSVDGDGNSEHYHVNIESGEVVHSTLSFLSGSELTGQGQQALPIIFDLGDELVVGIGEQEFLYEFESQNGIAVEGQSITEYAIITEVDYLSNTPNYRPFDNASIITAIQSTK